MDNLDELEVLAALGDIEAKKKIRVYYQSHGLTHWYYFHDNNTFAIKKLPYHDIWIEARNEEEAAEIFEKATGRNPYYWSCITPGCCGTPDFTIRVENDDFKKPSWPHRQDLIIDYGQI